MSRQPSFPARSFGLLLVEGGDERGVCEAVAGPTPSGYLGQLTPMIPPGGPWCRRP
jgi:hypothetical protein